MPSAQVNPLTLPLVDLTNVRPVGSFQVGLDDGAGGYLDYGGEAFGVSEDGKYIYWSCRLDDSGIAKLEIPALGGTARVVMPCLGPKKTDIAKIHPDPNAWRPVLGGVLEQGGRICVTGYIIYDASGATTASHWCGPSLSQLQGPFGGTVRPGMVHAEQVAVPQEWRALLGGSAMASAAYTSIISRGSFGAAVTVYNPADVTKQNFPMTNLLSCPNSVPACVTYGTPTSNDYNGSEHQGGYFIAPGTRTLVSIERESSGPTCYGYATTNPAMHGTPYPGPGYDAQNVVWCYSLADPPNQKAPMGYPYRLVAKLYDMADLVAVKQGKKNPWDVKQYATVDLPGSSPYEALVSGGFNPVTGQYYLVRHHSGAPSTVDVYAGFGIGTPAPPTEVCGDGIDNDGDGLIDETCTEICGDKIDNDGDGLVDENCTEICGDKIDNDGDGLVDENCTEICGDKIDNDGDGLVDENCTEICGDKIDNDGDGLVDENCDNGPEICGDGLDNDGDGLIDENCEKKPEEVCGDKVDNDGDGLIDEGCESEGALPGQPQRLYGAVQRSNISLKWYPPLTGGAVADYVVEAGLSPGTTFYSAPVGMTTVLHVPNVGKGQYYVRIRAHNANGLGKPSNEVALSVGCFTRPRKPTALSATSRGALVNLTWSDPDGCSGTSYRVAVSGAGNTRTTSVDELSSTTVLAPGAYVAYVRSEAEAGVSDAAELKFTVGSDSCATPRFRSTLRSAVSGRHIGLFWTPVEPDLAQADDRLAPVSYQIEAGSAPGAADIGAVPLGRVSAFAADVPPGTYFVRIRPTNVCGGGLTSNEVKMVVR